MNKLFNVAALTAILLLSLVFITKGGKAQTFGSLADASVYQSGAGNNYGATTFQIKGSPTAQTRYGFIKFDLGTTTTADVKSAKLRIYCSAIPAGTTTNVVISNTSDNWVENVITYNNRPSFNSTLTSLSINASGKYYEWDVTNYVKALLLNKTIASFGVSDPANSDNLIVFSSKDYPLNNTNTPQLVISQTVEPTNTNTVAVIPNQLFSNNMVMQQSKAAVPVFGKAGIGTTITVTPTWNNIAYTGTTDINGQFSVNIATPAANTGGPYSLNIHDEDGHSANISNIQIGEVWFCAGQSNMQQPLRGFTGTPPSPVTNSAAIIAASNDPDLRVFTLPTIYGINPQSDCTGTWTAASTSTSQEFSAIAYLYARELKAKLGVPIGVIVSAVGGTAIQSWMSKESLQPFPEVNVPTTIDNSYFTTTSLFNGMVNPVAEFGIKGFLWCQGESNRQEPYLYKKLFPALIADYRSKWNNNDLPFYFVQIAPNNYSILDGGPVFREVQYRVSQSVANTGISLPIDVGDAHNIHYGDKTTPAKRLSYIALNQAYGITNTPYLGPDYRSVSFTGNAATLSFNNADGLKFTDNVDTLFKIAGADKKFYPATGVINPLTNQITVRAKTPSNVPNPVAVSYAFSNFVVGNLFNGDNLPASSFRTINWDPVTTSTSTPKTYYIDANNGDDSKDGLSLATAWKSLANPNSTVLTPGSQLLFKAGGAFTGQLAPLGSGASGSPIIIDKYGTGAKPIINGNGLVATGTLKLYNQSYIEVNNLEITNTSTTPAERRGVEVSGANIGVMNHIYLKNLVVHDVSGTVGNNNSDKKSAAIYFTVNQDDLVDTRYNDILVDGCEIYNVQQQGIVTNNETSASDYPGSTDWIRRRITNLIFRNNTIYNVDKNAMIVRLADGGLVEHNLCHDTSYGIDGGGANIGGNIMFSRSSQNTIFQYNEGYNNKGVALDGSMYDPDLSSPGVIFQYSYSHDNAAGLLWVCTSAQDVGVICRYNVSQNDKGSLVYFNFDFADVKVYNNTFYVGAGLKPRIIQENTTRNHTYSFYNNIVYNDPANSSNPSNNTSGVRFSFAPAGSTGTQNRTITDNIFYNTPTPTEIDFSKNLTSNPLFVEVNKATTGLNTVGGYKLRPNSPALGNGRVVPNNGGKDYFGFTVSATAKPNIGFYNGVGTTSATVDPNFHIYLLTGQSNMSGRGYLSQDTYVANPRIKMLKQDGTWVTAVNPLHGALESSAGVGPGLAFATEMLKNADPSITIGLIPTAIGGQPIAAFAPGAANDRNSNSIYDESVKFVNIAKTTGVLKGVLFHQGESNNSSASSWVTGVKALINNFRTAFNDPKLPFIFGEMGRFPGYETKYANILAVMPGVASDVPFTALVSSGSLLAIPDDATPTHFTTASTNILGQRYALAMKSAQATLPVTLTKFTAIKRNEGALIQWTTASELNNDYFDLERSVNGKEFAKIFTVVGNGTSNKVNNYTFTDKNPNTGVNYYRLVQVDFDGKKATSDVVALTFNLVSKGEDFAIILYPNPTKDKIFINLKAQQNQQVKVGIYNLQGQLLKQLLFAGNEVLQQDIQNLVNGIYIVRVLDAVTGKLIGESKFLKY